MDESDFVFEHYNEIENIESSAGKINTAVFKSYSKNWVPYFVYLPPNWTKNKNYPLVLFLHGQGGDETTFKKYVNEDQLNNWILSNEIEPVVIAGIRGDNDRENVQWFTPKNESFIAGNDIGEFVHYCRTNFNAGMDEKSISIEGHSRGAAGAIHYYLKYPGKFISVIGMGYVSDYTLETNKEFARVNQIKLQQAKVPLRLEIGTEDSFVRNKNRRCSFELHDFLAELQISHEFELLHGVEHRFDYFWQYNTNQGILNGLRHLKFHENARKKRKD